MDLRDLRYFETIATLEHLGRASAKLHRTQPALTSCIRRLEQECGMPLFEKAGRGIRLTAAGAVLLKWAQRMRFDMQDALSEMGDVRAGLSGEVRLGVVPTAAQSLLAPVARRLLLEAPSVSLKTMVGLIDNLKPLLQSGDLDLLLGTEATQEDGFISRVVAEDAYVVVSSADHALQHQRPSLKAMTQYDWALLQTGSPTRDWLDQLFDQRGLARPRARIESNMLLVLPSVIAESGLLSFMSRQHLLSAPGGSLLREVPLAETTMKRRTTVMWRADSYLSPAASRMVNMLCAS